MFICYKIYSNVCNRLDNYHNIGLLVSKELCQFVFFYYYYRYTWIGYFSLFFCLLLSSELIKIQFYSRCLSQDTLCLHKIIRQLRFESWKHFCEKNLIRRRLKLLLPRKRKQYTKNLSLRLLLCIEMIPAWFIKNLRSS